mmetsp:Transcript_27098/g.23956  ORF Transcript_27098/g.23956 Transcript_27098/m.23956 type:complete len:101 (-) Transcript_27098:456-758(-)
MDINRPLTKMEEDTWKNLFKPVEKRKLIAAILVRVIVQFTGMYLIFNYAYFFIFTQKNYNINLRFIIMLLGIPLTFVAMLVLTKFKRKPVFLIGCLSMCA